MLASRQSGMAAIVVTDFCIFQCHQQHQWGSGCQ